MMSRLSLKPSRKNRWPTKAKNTKTKKVEPVLQTGETAEHHAWRAAQRTHCRPEILVTEFPQSVTFLDGPGSPSRWFDS